MRCEGVGGGRWLGEGYDRMGHGGVRRRGGEGDGETDLMRRRVLMGDNTVRSQQRDYPRYDIHWWLVACG